MCVHSSGVAFADTLQVEAFQTIAEAGDVSAFAAWLEEENQKGFFYESEENVLRHAVEERRPLPFDSWVEKRIAEIRAKRETQELA